MIRPQELRDVITYYKQEKNIFKEEEIDLTSLLNFMFLDRPINEFNYDNVDGEDDTDEDEDDDKIEDD